VQSGNIGVAIRALPFPRYERKTRSQHADSRDQNRTRSAKQIGSGQFVLGSSKVRPRLDADFSTTDKLGIYMQVTTSNRMRKLTIQRRLPIPVKKGDQQIMQFKETSDEMKQTGDQNHHERLLASGDPGSGKYTIEITPRIRFEPKISRTADFTVKQVGETKTAAIRRRGG